MTRKNCTTAEITAGRTDTERLLSLASADAADAERAVASFRLTQLVMTRFDMDVVEAARPVLIRVTGRCEHDPHSGAHS
jgi:hypothetical protein